MDNREIIEKLGREDLHEDMTFESVNFQETDINDYSFDNCIFKSCSFDYEILFNTRFIDCKIVNSNMSIGKIENVTLNGVDFIDSKLVGLNYTKCNKFGFSVNFEKTIMLSNTFSENNLLKSKFIQCKIENTAFYNCNLQNADFSGSRFQSVLFEQCNLEKANFLESKDYTINPFSNKLKKAKFDLPEAVSFLNYLEIDIK